jgi:hypothetical protein
MLQKKILEQLKLYQGIILGIALAIGLSVLAFTEPSLTPPGCTAGTAGCDAPLNVGTTGQSKSGWLRATKFFVGNPPTVSEQGAGDGLLRTTMGAILNEGGAATGLIVQSGNVGIGTTNPKRQLHQAAITRVEQVYDVTDAAVDTKIWRWHIDGTQLYGELINDAFSTATAWLTVQRSGTTVTDVSFPNGNVGIGTTNPGQKLDVVGNAAISGTLTVSGQNVCRQDGTNCPPPSVSPGIAIYRCPFRHADSCGSPDGTTCKGLSTDSTCWYREGPWCSLTTTISCTYLGRLVQ